MKVFTSFGHAIAWAAKHISAAFHKVESVASSPQAQNIETTIENVSRLFLPATVVDYEDLAFHAFGVVAEACEEGADAIDAQGVNIKLDVAAKAAFLAAFADIKAALAKGTSPIPPAK